MSLSQQQKSEERRNRFMKNLSKAVSQADPTGKRAASVEQLETVREISPYQPDVLDKDACLERLREFLKAQNTELYDLANAELIPQKLSEVLATKNYGTEIMIGENPFIQSLNWQLAPELKLVSNNGQKVSDLNLAMTHAFAAAAETGTLFFTSGPENPTPLNYLPTCHIALLDAQTIHQTYEQAYQFGEEISVEKQGVSNEPLFPKRSLNLISGPSRTADIEQTLTLGAHGPLELVVLIYNV